MCTSFLFIILQIYGCNHKEEEVEDCILRLMLIHEALCGMCFQTPLACTCLHCTHSTHAYMSGGNIKLTRPFCHELWKMVLRVLFYYTLPYMEKTLSTTGCSSGYRLHRKVKVVSPFSSCHQLCLVKISS